MNDRRVEIADVLRGRLLRALHGGALRRGDRLPSARELGDEFETDHRLVLDSYRILEREGLIEMRPRGGIYVVGPGTGVPLPSAVWLTDVLSQALLRELPLREVHEWLRGAVEILRLRVVAVQSTPDQVAGLCRELEDDYGLESTGLNVADLTGDDWSAELRYADLIVTTQGLETAVRPVADSLGKRLIVVQVRPDLIGAEWRMLLRRPIHVVVHDATFVDVLLEFFADVPGVENIRPLVAGRDDLSQIPDGEPVYVTRSARARLGGAQIRGRILPTARLVSAESSLELVRFIVESNMAALAARQPGPAGADA